MIDDVKSDAEHRMQKSLEALEHELRKLRTGRAHASLLDHVKVSYYGSDVPVNQVASINIADPRTLAVSPWEKKMVPAVEKAILNADLGLNPVTSGDVIRVPLPPLTEERRRDMTRLVRQEAETARVAIRNVRRDANHALKAMVKDKTITEDDERRGQDAVQKLTDHYIAEVEQILKRKEADLMEI
jgi:ribosome recycling factor